MSDVPEQQPGQPAPGPPSALDQAYDALSRVDALAQQHDTREQDLDALAEREQELQAQLAQAEKAGDQQAAQAARDELDMLDRAWQTTSNPPEA